MYQYIDFVPLTKEEIFTRVSQEDIFKIVFDQRIEEGRYYVSPFRSDLNPGCFFWKGNRTKKLFFVDYGDRKTHRDCFNVLQEYYGLSYNESLKLINEYFGLGLGDESFVTRKEAIFSNEEDNNQYEQRNITIIPRPYINKDRLFWEKYEISSQNLIDDKVVAVELFSGYTRRGEQFSVRPLDVCYAFTEFNDHRKKIYRPYGTKRTKWFTNCKAEDIGSIDHLPLHGQNLIISKSYKDCRVLRNQGLNSIWLQNEGIIPPTEIIVQLGKRFENLYVFFDNDEPGIIQGEKIVSVFDSIFPGKTKHIHLPNPDTKDPSDLIHKFGRDPLIEFLQNKNLL